ncbi:SpoIIE family protein phosphatase [Paracrocinitomix mangrovi]|uniref:two-component regulator propeller domain-containing protein n=1 Tax=Paracrocinitomix mangrovi TaxID=2862509 RepID=UPI001C8D5CED|nr:two-component regulator propeller domain-containing protein [Paracrocinitomix mangrovi]UKN00442.1 SpoIIE family protein phosphatase [Paracrocinitomix mangrovi]
MRYLCLYLLLISQLSFGQKFNFVEYGIEEGLPQSQIKDLYQDSKGYLWICTHGGIAKFDGKNFKSWTKEDGLLDAHVISITESDNGQIIAGTRDGLIVIENDQLKTYSLSQGVPGKTVWDVENINGKIWIATDKGICFFENDEISLPNDQHHFLKSDSRCIEYDYKNELLYLYSGNKFYTFQNNQWDSLNIEGVIALDICVNENGQVFIGQWNAPQLSTIENGKLVPLAEKVNSPITKLFVDNNKNVWASSWDKGMLCLHPDYTYDQYSIDNGLPSNSYWGVIQDNESNMWFGSFGGGLIKFSQDPFVHYDLDAGLPSIVVNAVKFDSKNRLWIGTDNGVKVGVIEGLHINWIDGPWDKAFSNKKIVTFYEMQNGNMAIGCYDDDYRMSIFNGTSFYHFKERLGAPAFWFHETTDGTLWAGTDFKGVFKTGPKGDEFIKIKHGDNRIITINEDLSGNIWMGTYGHGINILIKDSVYVFNQDKLEGTTISKFIINDNGTVWAGTDDRGVLGLKLENNALKVVDSINTKNGAIDNKVTGLNVDSKGDLWVGTSKGIMIIHNHLNDRSIKSYSKADGFIHSETTYDPFAEYNDYMYIATSGGITRMDMNYEYQPSGIDKLVFSELQLEYKNHEIKDNLDDYGFPEKLDFNYDQNHLTFYFNTIHFSVPEKVKYRFKMEGLDPDWTPYTKDGKITYSSLNPGNYTLHVQAINSLGDKGIERTIEIRIKPPFWQTIWFKVSVGILLILIVYGIFRWRTNKLRKDREKLEKTVTERTLELRHQKEIVEEKNKEITDSISYAKRIQTAILPPDKLIRECFPNSFVWYLPKDIVAGDFYWMELSGDHVLFAAADCTGHGVPGAMVSVVCHVALNRTVREFGIVESGKVLDKTRELVVNTFERSEMDVRDGMDIALVSYNRKTKEITYSGAHNPLWLIRNNEVIEYKADKQPIGKFEMDQAFTSHTIQLEKGDQFYLFSDGYADQFGGDRGKKFKGKNFKDLLQKNAHLAMDIQLAELQKAFYEWKGDYEQLDDVCVIGVRI